MHIHYFEVDKRNFSDCILRRLFFSICFFPVLCFFSSLQKKNKNKTPLLLLFPKVDSVTNIIVDTRVSSMLTDPHDA
ncbi:hypothetical protein LY76DRAFT_401743 [Colletotrichum caudatum]|nr:hypothetical protein LY76DRAFT_401743 [Colletotrichum caudatum]